MSVDSDYYAKQTELAKLDTNLKAGTATLEDLISYIESLRIVFSAWGAQTKMMQLKTLTAREIDTAQSLGLITDYRASKMIQELDSMYFVCIQAPNEMNDALDLIKEFLCEKSAFTLNNFDPVKTKGVGVVFNSVKVVYDYFAWLNSPEFIQSILNKVAILGMAYCEIGSQASYSQADDLLKLLVLLGRIKEEDRHHIMMVLSDKASDFSQQLSETLSVDLNPDGERTNSFE